MHVCNPKTFASTCARRSSKVGTAAVEERPTRAATIRLLIIVILRVTTHRSHKGGRIPSSYNGN